MNKRFKYFRTYHLPWSLGATDDDKTLRDLSHFDDKTVVVTTKMDGENTSLYADGYVHARSIDGRYHASSNWIKADWASKCWELNPKDRIVGENLFAAHSIRYNELKSYFYGFAVFRDNWCYDWDTTCSIISQFNYPTPSVLYHGKWDRQVLNDITQEMQQNDDVTEGYVVRNVDGFSIDDAPKNIAKYVRANHVRSDKSWKVNWTQNHML